MTKKNYTWVRNPEDVNFEKNLSHNAFISVFCSFLNFSTRFFIPPIILNYLSIEIYGIWSYCFILINYYGMSFIGMSNVYVRFTAIYTAHHQTTQINKLLSTGLTCSSVMSLLVIALCWNLLPFLFPIFHIPDNLYHTAFVVIFATLAIFTIELTLGIFKHVLEGLQKVGLSWSIFTAAQLLETVLIILFLYEGLGIYALLYAYMIRVITSALGYTFASFYYIPNLALSWKYFDSAMFQVFYEFGGVIQLRSILGIINRSLPRLLSGIFVGAQGTALCDLGEKFPVTANSIASSALYVFLPAGSHLYAKGQEQKLRNLYLYGCRYMSILTGLMMGFLAPFSGDLIFCWLGSDPKYETVSQLIKWLSFPYQILVITGPASAAFRSMNLPKKELVYGIFEIVLAILGGIFGIYVFGYSILGIVSSIGLTFAISSGVYLIYTTYFLQIKMYDFLTQVILPGIFPYLIGVAIYSATHLGWSDFFSYTDRWSTFLALLLSLSLYILIAVPLYYFFILNSREQEHLYTHYFKRMRFHPTLSQTKGVSSLKLANSLTKTCGIWEERRALKEKAISTHAKER